MGSLQSAVCDDTGYQLYADGRRHDGRGVCQGPNPFHQNHFDNSVYGCLSYNYYVLPSFKVRYRDIVPGSVFASAGFLIVTYVYNLYTQVSQNYNILYGSFSNIVVLMFWFWFVSWVMCLGVTLNRVWWATRKEGAVPIAPEAMAKRKPINIF